MSSQAKPQFPAELTAINKTVDEMLVQHALEGIYPTEQTLNDLALLRAGTMTVEKYRQYLISKHQKNPTHS